MLEGKGQVSEKYVTEVGDKLYNKPIGLMLNAQGEESLVLLA